MPKPIVVTPAAKEEAIAARKWYAERNQRIAPRFVEELERVIQAIASRPKSFPVLEQPLRGALLKTFPYYIVFQECDQEIRIVAVCHASRQPGYWRGRLDS